MLGGHTRVFAVHTVTSIKGFKEKFPIMKTPLREQDLCKLPSISVAFWSIDKYDYTDTQCKNDEYIQLFTCGIMHGNLTCEKYH
jgi:uncharacterized protein YlxP (DUF503 family)